MAKHTVKMGDYDETSVSAGYTGAEPRRGVYEGKMISVDDHTSAEGNEGLVWVFEITKGEFKGWRGYQYSNLDGTLWKTQQICYAITGSKKDVVVDTDKLGAKMVKKAKPVTLRVKTEMFEGERRAKLNAVLPALGEDDDEDEGEDPFE